MSDEASLVAAMVSADAQKIKNPSNNKSQLNRRLPINFSFVCFDKNFSDKLQGVFITRIIYRLLDDFRFSFDREFTPGQSLHNLIDTGLRVVEFYGDFMRELVRIILQYARDFLQGSPYPVSGVRSLTSGNHHFDNSFGGQKGL